MRKTTDDPIEERQAIMHTQRDEDGATLTPLPEAGLDQGLLTRRQMLALTSGVIAGAALGLVPNPYEAEARRRIRPMRLAVPAFWGFSSATDPGPFWRAVEAAGKNVRFAVAEYSLSQVDPVTNPDLWNTAKQQFSRCRNRGQQILGYVSTQNGNRSRQQIDADLDAWYARYPAQLDGIFLDEGPMFDDSKRAFYEDLISDIKQTYPGRTTVMLNAPQFPNEWVVQTADNVILWEERAEVYLDPTKYQALGPGGLLVGVPSWWKNRKWTSSITHIIHTCPTAQQMATVVRLARKRNAGSVYVYDGDSSSYGRLPSYWKKELKALAR
jgi:hypothetical protein